jgi:hypothetical protein
MDLKEIMAVNLRRKRHDLEMTQEELAERAGLSARYVGAIERGDVSASVTVLGLGGRQNRRRWSRAPFFNRHGRWLHIVSNRKKPRPICSGGAWRETYSPFFRGRDHSRV